MEFNGTFLATIVTFILFVYVMNKILYAPILEIMEKRESVINGNYKIAEENNTKSEILSEERKEKLNYAKDEAREKYLETIEEYKSKNADTISAAQNNSKKEVDNANAELANISDDVKNGLKGYMNDLANDIVEKVIGYRTSAEGFDDAKVNEVLWSQKV
jgi:F-type H+-transporting ATPase subunit b